MYLLLAGSSATARELIVDAFLDSHKEWRHLALEDIEGEESEDDILGMQQTFSAMMACEIAKEEHAKGHSVLITCPDLDYLDTVLGAFDEPVVSIHLGDNAPDGFSVVLPDGVSVKEALSKLEEAIA